MLPRALKEAVTGSAFWRGVLRDDLRAVLRRHTRLAIGDVRVRGGVWEACIEGNWIAVRTLLKPEGRYGRIAA